jgi:hypothetical protein
MLTGPFLEPLIDDRLPLGAGGRFYGVYPAVVADIADPDAQGRVRVRLPWAPDSRGARWEAWARIATLFAGGGRGSWFVPDVDDEVLVAFAGRAIPSCSDACGTAPTRRPRRWTAAARTTSRPSARATAW